MTQAEVLSLLRKVPFNDVVELVISRQETDLSPSPSLPRQLVMMEVYFLILLKMYILITGSEEN